MDISVKYLSQLKTISTLKVLVAFLTISETEGNSVTRSLDELAKQADISVNGVKSGINELVKLDFIEQVGERKGKEKATYLLKINQPVVEVAVVETAAEGGYMRATGAKKKDDVAEYIDSIDLHELSFFEEDINSIQVFNVNQLMDDKEIGRLARRIVNEIHRPRVNRVIPDRVKWTSLQVMLMKRLLVKYRTEQVIAAIRYWTEIETSPNGLMSLSFLNAKSRKGRQDNIMVALDHYKTEYLSHVAPVDAQEDAEQRRVEQLRKERDEQAKLEVETAKVENMTDEEFVDQHMNRYANIANKFRKRE